MATLGEVQVKITADLAPLHSAMAEAKKMMAGLDKELSKSRKIVVQTFDMQKQVDQVTGVDKALKSASDSAAIFSSALSNKNLNPMLAAYDKYRDTLNQVNLAFATGVINQERHSQATLEAKGAYDTSVASLYKKAAALEAVYGIQSKIDASFKNEATPRDSSDIDAYARALDSLRAKFDPLFAASKNYENSLNELDRAFSTGAIPNVKIYEAALESLNAAYAKENAILSSNTAALNVNAAARQSVSFALGKQINEATGVRSGSQYSDKGFKSAEESAQNLERQIESLTRKHLPLIAAQENYNQTIKELDRLALVTKGNEAHIAAARVKAANQLQNQTTLIEAQTNAQKLNNQQSLNMGMQLNDIAVMLASGQNPFVMMMQQGMQIGQIFDQAGVKVQNAGSVMLSSITGFLTNPINIAVVAVAALAGSIPMIWEALQGSPAKTAQEVLDGFRSRLDDISKSSETAGNAIQGMFDRLSSGTFDELLAGVKMTENELKAGLGQAIDDLQGKLTSFRFVSGDNGLNFMFNETVNQIDEMLKKVKEGSLGAEEFSNSLSKIYLDPSTPEQIKDFISEIRTGVLDVRQLDSAYQALQSSMASPVEFAATQAMDELQRAIDNVNSSKAKTELEKLKEKIDDNQLSSEELLVEFDRISGTYLNVAGITSGLQDVFNNAVAATKAMNAFANTTAKTGRQRPLSDNEFKSRFQGEITESVENEALRDAIGSSPKPKKGPKAKKPKDKTKDIAANKQFIQDLEKELEILGASYEKREVLRKQFELEKEVRTQIAKLSETMGPKELKQAEEMIRLKSLLVEEEKRIKELQKQQYEDAGKYGDIIGNALGSAISGAESLEQALIKAGLQFAQMIIQAQILETFGKNSAQGNFWSQLIGGIFSSFGGGRATGGNVTAGKAYTVGENGREMFVPKTDGYVVPNNKLEGSNKNNRQAINNNYSSVYNITGSQSDGEMIRKELEKRDRKLQSQIISTVKSAQSRRQLKT